MVESNRKLEPQKLAPPHKRPHIYAVARLANGLRRSYI